MVNKEKPGEDVWIWAFRERPDLGMGMGLDCGNRDAAGEDEIGPHLWSLTQGRGQGPRLEQSGTPGQALLKTPASFRGEISS